MKDELHRPPIGGNNLSTAPDLYFQVQYAPKADEPNSARARCEQMADGIAIAAYLSPFHALVDAAYFSTPGHLYHVIHASRFDPTESIQESGGRLRIHIHLAWGASNRRLALRNRGQLCAWGDLQQQSVAPESMDAITFKVGAHILQTAERLHEHAGLFDYRETFAQIFSQSESWRHRAVAKAIHSIPGTLPFDAPCTELALYDPESETWHFVPLAAVRE